MKSKLYSLLKENFPTESKHKLDCMCKLILMLIPKKKVWGLKNMDWVNGYNTHAKDTELNFGGKDV